MKFTIEIGGGQELARKLNALPEAVGKSTVSKALTAGGEVIRQQAANRMKRSADAPHAADHVVMKLGRSGHSIAIGPQQGKGRKDPMDFYYWLFQEYGTVKTGAQPALRPAFDSQGQIALGIIGRELWAAVRDYAVQSGASVPLPTTASGTFL